MKICTAVQEACDYKDTLRAQRYFASLAKYFTVCITYQPAYVPIQKRYYCDICHWWAKWEKRGKRYLGELGV